MSKKEAIEKIKSIPAIILSFVVVIAFFSLSDTIYNHTLISFAALFSFSFVISLVLFFKLFRKIFHVVFEDFGFLIVSFGLTMYAVSLSILWINYIPIGKPIQKEYKILDAYSRKTRNSTRYYAEIKWKGKPMQLKIFQEERKSILNKKKIILETRRGLLGLQVIKNKMLK